MNELLYNIVSNLPEKPGVYQYLNSNKEIIYVGKAKNLKRRVSSYFHKEQTSVKTKMLVRHIVDIKYIVVDTEEDALLLENNLIKKHKPRYNVLLKDDKTYPWICIKNEMFPRIIKTRQFVRDGSTYYGPYSSAFMLKTLLSLIEEIYPLRNCSHKFNPHDIVCGKYKVCLQYHIKKCMGPCVGKQDIEEYNRNIEEIKEIIKGNIGKIQQLLLHEMKELANDYKFEAAQKVKEKYEILENYRCKSTVVSNLITNVDVFSIEKEAESAYINFLHVVNGAITQAYTFEYKCRLDEDQSELLRLGVIEMRQRFSSKAHEIVLPFPIELEIPNPTITIPQRGEKKKLLDLSLKNVQQYKIDQLKRYEKLSPGQRGMQLTKELQQLLHLEKPPIRIECFDNSNIAGSEAVAACVVFTNAKPDKKAYRKYTIKTVNGPDDYASMQEVVRRRYRRMIAEEHALPDLIIADGGKGQMESIRKVLEELDLNIPIAGLVKNDKHRTSELLFGFPPQTIGLEIQSGLFKLLTHIQDEVHRFAISFHRDKRSKHQTQSELDNIPGIGSKSKEALLQKFKSIKRIKASNVEEISKIIGEKRAIALLERLNGRII